MNFTFTFKEIILISPAIVIFLASLVPIFFKVINKNKEPSEFFSLFVPLMGAVSAIALSIVVSAYKGTGEYVFSQSMVIDEISIWASMIVSTILLLTIFVYKEHGLSNKSLFSEYIFLLMNSAVGMMILAWSNDLVLTFIGIEMMSLCLYILIAISKETVISKEAAIKYFVLGSFASAILLFGVSFIYGSTGSTYLHEIANVSQSLTSTSRMYLIGIGLVIVGFAFKVSIFPFHSWTPDVYQGASTPLTGFMATAVKFVTFIALIRFVMVDIFSGEYSQGLMNVMQWLAVLTMFAGNLAAILQTNLKRMLAYSSIGHSGYLFVGLIASGFSEGQILGVSGVVFYLFSYAVVTLGAFFIITLFEKSENTVVTIDSIKGLSKSHPLTAVAITLFMLSLAGAPPTVGFFGKFYLFSAAVKMGFYWLAVWGVINSVISVYYYLRPVVVMYMSEEETALGELQRAKMTRVVISASAIAVIAFGVYSGEFYSVLVDSFR